MTTPRVKALTSALRQSLKPALATQGFSFETSTRTFRRAAGSCTQIVNFQVGVRSLEGQFTVNLALFHPQYNAAAIHGDICPERPLEYHCVLRQRLSILRETLLTRYFQPRMRGPDSFLGHWLTTPADKWWRFTEDEKQAIAELKSVERLLQAKGIPWLERNSEESILKAEYSKLRPLPLPARGSSGA